MKKILSFFIIILLFFDVAHSQEDDWYVNSQNLIINIELSSGALIKPTSSDYSVKYININLTHFPYESFNQEILDLGVNPEADVENNAALFNWENPKNKITFGYNAKIKTNNDIIQIKEKIPFPLLNLPDELEQFTKPAEIIDSDDEDIVRLASKIVEGEDDLYVVVHKVAEWTKNNIDYNLSTLTAKASLKASWVLEHRQGVCDELTSLFIAMLRSLGIPTKFISGVAYTNSPMFPENWGSHGWAEVYFPGYGWVPYDVTYGQFGYIDPTHVKLKEAIDGNEPSVQYKWVSRNIELDTEELDIDASVAEKRGRAKNLINLDVNVLRESVDFGSYNLVEVALENLEDYYISSEIYISRPKEVEVIEDVFKDVLLKPREKKNVFWIVKLTGNLQPNFIYTFPITIGTIRNFTKSTSFKSVEKDIDYSFEEIQSILQQKKEEEEKIYSKDVEIDCDMDKKEFYSYEKALVQCKIKNIGNIFMEDLNICFESECSKSDLGIVQEKSFNFSVEKFVEGRQESLFKVENADVSKAKYVEYNVLDKPEIKVKGIEFPNSVEYYDSFEVSFLLGKESSSIPVNVEINFAQNNLKKTWVVNELPENRKFVINLIGKELRKGANEFNVIVNYEDRNGRNYETKEAFVVELVNLSLIQNVLLVVNSFIRKLENLAPKSLLFVLIGIVFVFIVVILIIFRKR